MLEDTEKRSNQNLLIERTYRTSKREVTIDNIYSLILSNNIDEKRVKQEACLLQYMRKYVECIFCNMNLLHCHLHYWCRCKFSLRILLQTIC